MSSMVQDAYDMGLTTSLGGMPKSSLYYDDYPSYDEENDYEDYDEEYIEKSNNDTEIIYEIGDVVKLNCSDDITMTINNVDNDVIMCRWFDKNHILQSANFNPIELDIIQKNSKLNQGQECNNSSNNIPKINIDEDEVPF